LLEDVPWTIDLLPFVFDEDNASNQLTFSVDSSYTNLNGSNLTLLYPEGVLNDTITLTVSDGLLSSSVTINVTITPVNDAPTLTGTPPTNFSGNGSLTYQFGATDPDNASGFVFTLLDGPSCITLSPAGLLNLTPPPTAHGRVNYTVQVADGAGATSAPRNFTIDFKLLKPPLGHLQSFRACSQLGLALAFMLVGSVAC